MTSSPMIFQWSGEEMVPLKLFKARCDEEYVVGERYRLAPVEQRYGHNRYFAQISEAWKNLPEDLAVQFPTREHLRKRALIKCGYHNSNSVVLPTKADALRVAALVRPMDEFSLVVVDEFVVTTFTAKSQKLRAMGPKEFRAAKDEVIAYLEGLIGVEPGALAANAGKSA